MDPVVDRQKSLREILSAQQQFASATAADLEALVAPLLEPGETPPDFVRLQELLAGVLEMRWPRLAAADEAWDDARDHHFATIDERKAAAKRLYREVVDLRLRARSHFGIEPARRLLGLRGTTSRDPVLLLRQGDRAVARLRDSSRALPSSKLPLTGAERDRWAAPIARAADALRTALARVARATKRLDYARLERERALDEYNDGFIGVASLFEDLYRLTGHPDWAAGVRPSGRRRGKTYLQVKRAARPATRPAKVRKSGVVVRFIAPLRQIFDRRRSA